MNLFEDIKTGLQEAIEYEQNISRQETDSKTKIYNRLTEDYNYVKDLGYNILGVFLQGSQNYGLEYEGSDIDTKAIIIPSFEDFVLNRKPVSTTVILPSNEHIDLKDIRLMHDCFRKQNINFVEILFTDFKIINPDYKDIYQPMFDNNERIAHYNNYAAVNCIAGMVFEKEKALCHPHPTIKDQIEKYGYSPKQLHHIARCKEFLERYINGTPYKKCLKPITPEYYVEIKRGVYPLEVAKAMSQYYVGLVKRMKDKYMLNHELKIDEEANGIMNDVLIKVLKHSFKQEII